MCGVAGVLTRPDETVERTVLERMTARLVHRGPDEEGYYLNHHAGLAQRRLRVIDLVAGTQPMANEDGSIWVTFNGEIYNFRERRAELERQGHRFATHSDTEVIVHAYEQHGRACVKHFRGMFAFALWDARRQTLLLARDRVGKKPLFYAEAGGQFVFASELQALVQHPGIRRQLDPAALDDYLALGFVPAPRTIFCNIFKLPPATTLVVQANGASGFTLQTEKYWELIYLPKATLSEHEGVEATLEQLTEAVRVRLVADVPVGALLSGGIDSSLVVALMSRLCDRPVKTFSIGFQERDFNELGYARLIAERYATEHHELIVQPRAAEILPDLVRHYGEPFADSSAVPSYHVARLTRQHVTVALNGDGGDESFGGYERYRAQQMAETYHKVPGWLRHGLVERLAEMLPSGANRRSRLGKIRRFLRDASLSAGPRYARWLNILRPEERTELYSDAFRHTLAAHRGEGWLEEQIDSSRRAGLGVLDAALAADVNGYLPFDLLVKMDIASMAHSLEARSPFLDHQVMEFAARLPAPYKVRRGCLKFLLKEVGRPLLPARVRRRGKMGFGVPVSTWLRGEMRPLLEDVLLASRSLQRGYFKSEVLRGLVAGHVSGQRDVGPALWALLWLELWHREFLD
jgi:asparagine synthase (glutamine-hydrolysing)